MYAAIQPVNCGIIPIAVNIREQLKAYYHPATVLAIPQADLALIREDIAAYERQLADALPSYGVAAVHDGGRGNTISDPTPRMAQQYSITSNLIRRKLRKLQAEEQEVNELVRDAQRMIRLIEIAISHLDDESRRLLDMRYQQDKSLQYIALEIYGATDPHTAVYHLEKVERALSVMLSRRAAGTFAREKSLPNLFHKPSKRHGANMVLSL